jgi:RimJ/RimL family protein N-acetyltransferase
MTSTNQLLLFHVQALFRIDANGRLLTTNVPDPQPAPRFFLGRTQDAILYRFRHDLPPPLVEQLTALALKEPVDEVITPEPKFLELFTRLLQGHAPIRKVWSGPAYRIPIPQPLQPQALKITRRNTHLLPDEFGWLRENIEEEQPCLGLVQDGRVVSICRTVRIGEQADEAGVETLPEYRGKSYAPILVSAWATAVHQLGRIPLYSTAWDNKASQAVARKLALPQYGVTFQIT